MYNNNKINITNTMITVTKKGAVYLDDFIICNRPGVVVECVKESPTKIIVNKEIQNPYTVSYASQGTLISFFSVDRNYIDDNTLEQAWFIDYNRAYFLCTQTQLDGYLNYIDNKEIGKMILTCLSETDFQQLDNNYAYTFLINSRGRLKILYIWDICKQIYIPPTFKEWKLPKFLDTLPFIVTKSGNFGKISKAQMTKPLIEHINGIALNNGKPLLVTIYNGHTIYPIRVLTKIDYKINKLLNSAPSKYEALLLAKLKNEDTHEFERRFFTAQEFANFNLGILNGFEKFKTEIYEKTVMRNWVCFPDKIYNTIRLGDIIDSKLRIEEKQQKACDSIKECTKGWKKDALFDFWQNYCSF